jgi:hypothetical protein
MPPAEAAADALPGRHPLVDRILRGGVSDAVRLAAARGALPIPAHDLVYVQVQLLADPAGPIAAAAAESLQTLPVETITSLLRDPGCDGGVIDHFARSGQIAGEVLATAVAHPNASDATLEALAAVDDPETLNLLVTNEQRVIHNPALFRALGRNTHLKPENRRRLIELERDFIGKEHLVVGRRPTPVPAVQPEAAPEDAGPEEGAPEGLATGTGEGAPGEEAVAEGAVCISIEPHEEDLRLTPAFQKILRLGVPERVQLALKGSAEERAILIRDSTRLVALQVLKCPKLADAEIATFASMRNIHEDVLRSIAAKRDWTKSYSVVHALLKNPRTPPGLSAQFLPRIGVRDLKLLARDRNIPDGLRRAAQTLFLARTEKSGGKRH